MGVNSYKIAYCSVRSVLYVSRIRVSRLFRFKINFGNMNSFRNSGMSPRTGDRTSARPLKLFWVQKRLVIGIMK